MNETERLAQRFIDQELTPEERVGLLLRLGHDDTLRRELLALEHVVAQAQRLPRPAVPHDFVARVMERTAPRPAWRRAAAAFDLSSALLRIQRLPRWNVAAVATVAVVAFVLGAAVTREASTGAPRTDGEVVAAASSQAAVLVRLVVLQPGATSVAAAGDFNDWNPARTPLEQVSDGVWTATIPVEPGRYEYMFVVNGREWISDPFAIEQSDDGFGARNAVLEVRPPSAEASL